VVWYVVSKSWSYEVGGCWVVGCCVVLCCVVFAYHVAGLGRAAGKDEDGPGAVGRAAAFQVVAGRGQLAGLDLGGDLELNGVGSRQSNGQAGGSEKRQELHVFELVGMRGCLHKL
jgi:hypothetical protein